MRLAQRKQLSSNFEAKASELLENIEEMFPFLMTVRNLSSQFLHFKGLRYIFSIVIAKTKHFRVVQKMTVYQLKCG